MPIYSHGHQLLLWQEAGVRACCIGPIYVFGPHQTEDISQSIALSLDKLALDADTRSGTSKIQQHYFLASLLDFE